MEFSIKLPLFEGPFDLLLFFIERDEIDIYDIPISQITQHFLDYLANLERLNMELASEFILVAATLMRIKSKMLLPRPQIDDQGNEIDPRDELVSHLLEYKKYKDVCVVLADLEQNRLAQTERGNLEAELLEYSHASQEAAELQNLTLYKILQSYIKVLQRFEDNQNRPVHKIVALPYTVEQQKSIILAQFEQSPRLNFLEIMDENREKIAIIFKFLAILELLQLNILVLESIEGFNDFWLSKNFLIH